LALEKKARDAFAAALNAKPAPSAPSTSFFSGRHLGKAVQELSIVEIYGVVVVQPIPLPFSNA